MSAVRGFEEKDRRLRNFLGSCKASLMIFNARYSDQGEPATRAKLTDKSVEVPYHTRLLPSAYQVNDLSGCGRCLSRDPLTASPSGGGDTAFPMEKQKDNEGTSRFRQWLFTFAAFDNSLLVSAVEIKVDTNQRLRLVAVDPEGSFVASIDTWDGRP
jgi:hypothetical protein